MYIHVLYYDDNITGDNGSAIYYRSKKQVNGLREDVFMEVDPMELFVSLTKGGC